VILVAVCATLASGGGARADSTLQLPNLAPLRPYDVRVAAADGYDFNDPSAPRALRFSVSTRNTGAYALELQAPPTLQDEIAGTASRKPAYQCVAWQNRVCTESRAVGELMWHEPHQHWHFQDYARYELRRVRADGTPDYRAEGLVAPGEKASFCLEDTDAPGIDPEQHAGQDFTAYYADLATTGSGLYLTCDDKRQGISVGWSDTYGSGLPGQQIPLDGVAPGEYALVVTIDPSHRFYETTHDDNAAFRLVTVPDADVRPDRAAPLSIIDTPDRSTIAPGPAPGVAGTRARVEGTVTDADSGVARVIASWKDARGITSSFDATVSCTDAARRDCTWTANNAAPGTYGFSVAGVDRAGNAEQAGPSISVVNV
jgi:hypothetical protein